MLRSKMKILKSKNDDDEEECIYIKFTKQFTTIIQTHFSMPSFHYRFLF